MEPRISSVLVVGDQPIDHLAYRQLVDSVVFTEYKPDKPTERFTMLLVDCEVTTIEEVQELQALFASFIDRGRPVLLLNPTNGHKATLSEIVGFSNTIDSAAYMVVPLLDHLGNRHFKLVEQAFTTEAPEPSWKSVSNSLRGTELESGFGGDQREGTYLRSNAALEPRCTVQFTKEVYDALCSIVEFGYVEFGDSPPPKNAPFKSWSYQINHTLAVPGAIPAQNQTLSGTTTIAAYLNNKHAGAAFFDVHMDVSALYSANMAFNSDTERGYATGGVAFNLSDPPGLSYQQASPQSKSGSKTYESSTSFTVDVGAGTDGATSGFSYTEGSSESYSLDDWYVHQLGSSHWNFRQNLPYNGEDIPDHWGRDGGVTKDGVLAPLPALSTSSVAMRMQTVWRTASEAITGKQTFSPTWTAYPILEQMSKTGKDWKGTVYYFTYGLSWSDKWEIDYSNITWTGPH